MKAKILKQLRETNEYISGQSLCDLFNVSRTAIWKVIKQLKEEGYEISSVSNKGYKLLLEPDIITKEELASIMDTDFFGKKIIVLDEVDSTNTYAKLVADKESADGLLVVAQTQLQGKGRRGRTWSSPKGSGIWMSIGMKPTLEPTSASMLTLVAGIAVVRAIYKQLNINTLIKWPNDIVANGKKLCGILTEMSTAEGEINYVVVGIGINANIREFDEDISDKAISLYQIVGKDVHRGKLIAEILKEMEDLYKVFLKTGDMRELKEEYEKSLANMNKEVRIVSTSEEKVGIARGVNYAGELLVEMEDGTVEIVVSGEVSIRGMYSYV